jgi:hypothetical protein
MSKPSKLRATPAGKPDSELTRFKKLWRDDLAESHKVLLRELFVSQTSQAEIRKTIMQRHGINLIADNQLNAFRDWELDQRQREIEAEQQDLDRQQIEKEFGQDAPIEAVRTEVLKRSYARAVSKGDFASARETIVQDLNIQRTDLERRRITLLEKKAAQADSAKGILENKELSEQEKAARMHELFGIT